MPVKKSSTKKLSWKKIADSAKKELLQEAAVKWVRKRKNRFQQLMERLKNITNVAANNYALGIKHYDLGNYEDAILRFKFVTKLEPANYDAHYNLAASYLADGKKLHARAAAKQALMLHPDYPEAQEVLRLCELKDEPSAGK